MMRIAWTFFLMGLIIILAAAAFEQSGFSGWGAACVGLVGIGLMMLGMGAASSASAGNLLSYARFGHGGLKPGVRYINRGIAHLESTWGSVAIICRAGEADMHAYHFKKESELPPMGVFVVARHMTLGESGSKIQDQFVTTR